MDITTLLTMLADGEFRSGQDLANALGVSRTAVWKQLNKLADLGLELESVKGRGYRIPRGVDFLSEAKIRGELAPDAAALMNDLLLFTVIDSTNAELMRKRSVGAGSGLVCTAEQQTAGRGRLGRTWVSPFAGNVYLSLMWEFSQGAAALEGLSLGVGVAVVRALESLGVEGVKLKWPNDILHDGAKLGGVLLEMAGDASGVCQVVVGVGINVSMSRSAAVSIDQSWVDLDRICTGAVPLRSIVVAALINEMLPMVAGFESEGFGPLHQAWSDLDAYAGLPVVIHSGEKLQRGICRGVDGRGALQLETSTGIQSIFGGEISLRKDI
ncbi:MAG: BirA family biotin operon repressor/biotin-[acetyl-CoA-carboxylase] ligase [Halieaceae bacterium]|jgi:BirA family biotin operon repressor/biotin-[acetyl-CoA-carboxylase] ligase